jgi:hypothetical protein
MEKGNFGIGRSLHQCVPLSVRACQAIVSVLSSDCYLTSSVRERRMTAPLVIGFDRNAILDRMLIGDCNAYQTR